MKHARHGPTPDAAWRHRIVHAIPPIHHSVALTAFTESTENNGSYSVDSVNSVRARP